ncbi:MAG: spore germination protein, partial [Sporolactobacillus laevolacticus]|nr:spore germination protein [Sporolactobacillus laevolacticus]
MENQKEKKAINADILENSDAMQQILDFGPHNFDMGVRELSLLGRDSRIYYTNSLVDTSILVQMMREFMRLSNNNSGQDHVFHDIKQHLVHEQVEEI